MKKWMTLTLAVLLVVSCSRSDLSLVTKPTALPAPGEEEDPPPDEGGGVNWTFEQQGGLSGSYPFRHATWVRVDGPTPRPKQFMRARLRYESVYGAVRFDGVRAPEQDIAAGLFGISRQASGNFSDTIGTAILEWSANAEQPSGNGRWIELNWRRQDENIALPAQVRLILQLSSSPAAPFMSYGSQTFPVQVAVDTLLYTLQPAGPPP